MGKRSQKGKKYKKPIDNRVTSWYHVVNNIYPTLHEGRRREEI